MGARKLTFIFAVSASLLLTGCGGSLEGLAESILYPYETVNKRYPVQEVPPEGFHEKWFDLTTADGEAYRVHSWFYRNRNSKANTAVYFHGNGENLQTMHLSNFLGAMQQLNVNIVVVDYPAYGRSTGSPSEETLVASAAAAIDFAKKSFSGKVMVWGRSLGAAVALQAFAKTQEKADRLILTSPWTSFFEAAVAMNALAKQLPKEWLAKNNYNSLAAAELISKSVLIHHGLKDKLIPIKMGRKVAESFAKPNLVTLLEFAEREHNDIFQESQLWEDIYNFVQ